MANTIKSFPTLRRSGQNPVQEPHSLMAGISKVGPIVPFHTRLTRKTPIGLAPFLAGSRSWIKVPRNTMSAPAFATGTLGGMQSQANDAPLTKAHQTTGRKRCFVDLIAIPILIFPPAKANPEKSCIPPSARSLHPNCIPNPSGRMKNELRHSVGLD